jgi:hypothetical protein
MRRLIIVALGMVLSGCALQRAQVAQDARGAMVGLSKEQVLACMGPPANKAAEGQTGFGATIPEMGTLPAAEVLNLGAGLQAA